MMKIFKKVNQMKFQVIERNGNAVIPDAMFKLCGMENAKQISAVQLMGGILLMPECMGTYELITLIDALNTQACEFLEAIAAECGPCKVCEVYLASRCARAKAVFLLSTAMSCRKGSCCRCRSGSSR